MMDHWALIAEMEAMSMDMPTDAEMEQAFTAAQHDQAYTKVGKKVGGSIKGTTSKYVNAELVKLLKTQPPGTHLTSGMGAALHYKDIADAVLAHSHGAGGTPSWGDTGAGADYVQLGPISAHTPSVTIPSGSWITGYAPTYNPTPSVSTAITVTPVVPTHAPIVLQVPQAPQDVFDLIREFLDNQGIPAIVLSGPGLSLTIKRLTPTEAMPACSATIEQDLLKAL